MTRAVARTGLCLAAALSSVLASGCYVPGGGWTMRTGLDTRRRHKPSVFVELVDTRWDEYNRVATMNLDSPVMEVNGIVVPNGQPNGQSGFTLPAVNGLPGGMVPAAPPVPSSGEPNPLSGTPAESLPPPPPLPSTDGPTAQRGPGAVSTGDFPANDEASLRAAGDDDSFDDSADDGEDLARRNSNWFQRVSGRLSTKCRKAPANDAHSTADGDKAALRPSASRLFSRPR
jgi:hypothetical protein